MVDPVCIDPAKVQQAWPLAKDLIKGAIEATDLSRFEDIEKDVLSGDQLLWLAISDRIEAAATTHLIKAKDLPVCVLTSCGGSNRNRWLALLGQIEKYAKDEGCKCVRIYGRKGWERVLTEYRVEHVILERRL